MRINFLPLFLLFSSLQAFTTSLLANETVINSEDELTLYLAVFGLALIAIFALYLSSRKISQLQEEKRNKEQAMLEEHEKQDALISKIGENIYDIAKDSATNSHITKSENQLLAITTNLIDFLRIKSHKVVIDKQPLKLSNLLNDVSGTLKTNVRGREFELIYDIEKNLEKEIVSDTLNLSKVLINILLYCVENSAKELLLTIGKSSLSAKDDRLSFTLSSDLTINVEGDIDIFRFSYNEQTEEYDSLGLFIAKELAELMQGDLIARNTEDKKVEFLFSIPYIQAQREPLQDKYIISTKTKAKNILLIDSSEGSAKAIESILLMLGHDVKKIDKEHYTNYFEYFDIYDLIMLDEKLFTNKTVTVLENTNSKVLALSNLFGLQESFPNAAIADAKISKPFTLWQLTNVLQQLCSTQHDASSIIKDGVVNSGNAIVHRNSFQDTRDISLSSFSKFHGKSVLLVEDNVINQKVFIGVLNKSSMNIEIANHGKEALKLLEENKKYDIIFMDINMPIMDGYTTAIKIREQSIYNDIPIIALSALTSSDEVAKMFSSGMNGYMSKPLQKEKLYTALSLFVEHALKKSDESVNEESPKLQYPGLNISIGIAKSSANEVFYKEILTEFLDAYGDTDKIFEKLMQDFRYEQLRILCTDIRGLTGTIGAEKLNVVVTDMLKKLSYKKYDFIPELVKKYSIELQLINGSIRQYLSTSE
ncbi:MAG: response regulator [Campylobacterales bacterium]|nr:response regulator [Campylobacterales bacterium]